MKVGRVWVEKARKDVKSEVTLHSFNSEKRSSQQNLENAAHLRLILEGATIRLVLSAAITHKAVKLMIRGTPLLVLTSIHHSSARPKIHGVHFRHHVRNIFAMKMTVVRYTGIFYSSTVQLPLGMVGGGRGKSICKTAPEDKKVEDQGLKEVDCEDNT